MRNRRTEWLRDIHQRQRNVVFPDTTQNEARFWRNLSAAPRRTSTVLGLAVLGIFVCGVAGTFVFASFQNGLVTGLVLIIGTLVFSGSLLAAIGWGTRRALREVKTSRRKREE
jgi:hypothetical protein